MFEYRNVRLVTVQEWNRLVRETYGRPYHFQQQDGCKSRGVHHLTVPVEEVYDCENDAISEDDDSEEMGVSFAAWLARDPEQKIGSSSYVWQTPMWWKRNFYPHVSMVANDLHAKGLLEAGDYVIDIDW